jgi:hypothetical protein
MSYHRRPKICRQFYQTNRILERMGVVEDRAQFAINLITPAGLSPQRSLQTGTGYMVSRFSSNFVVSRDV